jgi:spermidine synthase
MSQLALAPEPAALDEKPRYRAMLAGIAGASFASLLLELSLTRLFSVVLFYHFAFLAVSVALLGLGAGGVFAYLRRPWLQRWSAAQLGTRLCLLNAVAIVAALWVVLHVPVSLGLDGHNFLRLTALYLACAVPFFFTGLLFAVVFAREASRVATLYGADLLGGAAACLAVVPALNWLGGPNAVLFAALVMAATSLVWSSVGKSHNHKGHEVRTKGTKGSEPRQQAISDMRWRRTAITAVGLIAVLIAANYSGLLFDVVYAKGWRQDLKLRLFAKWNSLSRVEVKQVGDSKYIVIDSDATTAIMNVDAHKWHDTAWEHNLMYAAPAVTNVLRPHGEYAIIGPGGGVDVLRAVANGSPRVVGIEINPIIANTIMRGRFADYAYHLYEIPEVTIHVSDGRSWLRSSKDQFDVVQMTLVDTWASTAAGAFALSENNLYTREAFREYFEHLRPDGLLAITRWEFRRPREALRVVAEAIDALHSLGVSQPAGNFIVVSDGPLDEDGRPVTVLVRKTPFTNGEEAALMRHLAESHNLALLYSPSHPQGNPFADLIRSNDPKLFAETYAYDVAPVDDNNPFFFFTLKTGDMLRDVLAGRGRGMDWRINLGVLVLGILLAISVAAVLLFLVLPLAIRSRGSAARQSIGAVAVLYFVAIGLGYIMAEITFIQRFVLFLGHPTYALTVVVFLMLLSSGAGSLAARRWNVRGSLLLMAIGAVAAVLLIDRLLLPVLLAREVGLPFAVKLAVSAALLAPVGFFMGMPFPAGLAALNAGSAGAADSGIEWAWAMNAASSVLGSVVAMLVAIHYGLNTTLTAAIAAYVLAACIAGLTLLPATESATLNSSAHQF